MISDNIYTNEVPTTNKVPTTNEASTTNEVSTTNEANDKGIESDFWGFLSKIYHRKSRILSAENSWILSFTYIYNNNI